MYMTATAEQCICGCYIRRLGEEITLSVPTLQRPKPGQLIFRLYPFRDHLNPQIARQHDDGLHDLAALIALHPADERAVDLQRPNKEVVEVAQARVADAEVVNGQLDAERPQLHYRVSDRSSVFHHHALRDL